MKNFFIGLIVATSMFLGGCSLNSFFTTFDEVAIDKHYVPKQCPTFNHQFEIPAKKFLGYSGDGTTVSVVMKTSDLLVSLETNTRARELFNTLVTEMNKTIIDKDRSNSEHRQIKKIFINRECPKYTYSPEFKARKLIQSFVPEENVTYVIVSVEKFTFEVEKHKKTVMVFNEQINNINK
jgi:hypothetical protein